MTSPIIPNVTDLEVLPSEQRKEDERRKKRSGTRQWGSCLFGLMTGLLVLAASRLGQLWPTFDVLAQFIMQGFILVFAFSAGLLMRRYRALTGNVIAVLLLVAYGAWPHLVSLDLSSKTVGLAQGEHALRLGTFNVFHHNADVESVAMEIERLDADAMALVEVGDHLQKLPDRLKARYPFQFKCQGAGACRTIILSKYQIVSGSFGTSPQAPIHASVQLGTPAGIVSVVAVRLARFPQARAQLRNIDQLRGILEKIPGPVIVAGDFNAVPGSRVLGRFESSSGLTRLTALPTWPSFLGLPQLPIDHVFVGNGARTLSAPQIGNSVGSDHYPLVVTLAIAAH